MNYNWLFIASLTTMPFSYGEESKESKVQNKTTIKLNTKSPSDRSQTKKKIEGSWMEHFRRQWEDEGPDRERGPIRDAYYNPSYGFEPYWPGGQWVFTPVIPKNTKTEQQTTTKKYRPKLHGNTNCGLKCGIIYKTYGEVCGRNRKLEYKSFRNYCALKSEDCDGLDDWRAVYQGPCQTVPLFWPTSIVFGPKTFIKTFQGRYRNTFRFVATNVGFPKSLTKMY